MKKTIEVTTPGNGKTYEFAVDSNMSVARAKQLLIKEITRFENDAIAFDETNVLLCSQKYRERLDDPAPLFDGASDDRQFLLI